MKTTDIEKYKPAINLWRDYTIRLLKTVRTVRVAFVFLIVSLLLNQLVVNSEQQEWCRPLTYK